MLVRMVASNFMSFKDEVEFNMLTGSFRTNKHHVYQTGKVEVLKAAALYGANGAGKSNLIKAINFLQKIVSDGAINKSVNEKKFKLDPLNIKKPVHLEIEFFTKKKLYSYGILIDQSTIIEEWLYEQGVSKPDKMIFERYLSKSKKPILKFAEKFQKTQKSKLLIELLQDSLLKHNQLLLGKTEELKIADIQNAKNWITTDLFIIYPKSKFNGLVDMISTSNTFKNFANGLLGRFDTGVRNLDVEDIDADKYFGKDDEDFKSTLLERIDEEGPVLLDTGEGVVLVTKDKGKGIVKKVISVHENNNGELIKFDLFEESDGTQRLLDYIPALDLILHAEATIIIDEIDQSLHPSLLKSLIQKVMDDKTTKGQLIFSTHESNLLDLNIFRQDEIWFVEKDKKTSATQLYSLGDFKPRFDLDIKKGYLNGRFGAIPFMANFEELNWNSIHEEAE